MADGDYYSAKVDIENIYGKENVSRWADADNNKNPTTIADRIDWANESAYTEFNARMVEGPYHDEIPLPIKSTGNTPKIVILICATLAGLYLFDTRRVIKSEETSAVSRQRQNVDRWIKQIFRGQLKIIAADGTIIEKSDKNHPININFEE